MGGGGKGENNVLGFVFRLVFVNLYTVQGWIILYRL